MPVRSPWISTTHLSSKRGARTPAVVFVTGFHDVGAQRMLGCRLKEMGSYVSWAQLAAASGLVGITYTNREPASGCSRRAAAHPAERRVPGHRRDQDRRLGVLRQCADCVIGADARTAREFSNVRSSVIRYMLDVDGSTGIAAAARQFGFVNPCAGKSVADLPPDVPLFIARAGQDQMPGLNEALDRFLVQALACNLPITFVNHAAGASRVRPVS